MPAEILCVEVLHEMRSKLALLAGLLVLGALLVPVPAQASGGPTVGANHLVDLDHGLLFPQNKQNEPSITRDPLTGVLVAGANEEIGQPLCAGTTAPLSSPCPFNPGVSTSGYYRSTDGGSTWTGAYLPGFDTIGRASGGDPSLDFGPRLCANGSFSYSCGAVIYYGSLADPFPEFGGELGTVSRTYDDGQTWANPVVATSTGSTANFVDHEWIAVDKVAGSPYFGRVYMDWAVFCNSCAGNGNVKIYTSHSNDEGRTWTKAVKVSAANSNTPQGFRETGQMTVASDGTVEVFWTENADSPKYPSLQVVTTSKDGGDTYTAPITIAQVTDYPVRGTPFDVVDLFNRVPGMSARVDCYPHPAADPSSNRVYVVWCDFSGGHGTVKAAMSSDGLSWTSLGTIANVAGRNAFFPQAAVTASGKVAVAFDALSAPPANNPWQTGVQTYDAYVVEYTGGAWSSPVRVSTATSNPDVSAYNNLMEQFIGDYIGIVAGSNSAWAVWTDTRNGAACSAVNVYRSAIYGGSSTAVAPNPNTACPINFGDTDTYVASIGL
jgi:hypothetical protein